MLRLLVLLLLLHSSAWADRELRVFAAASLTNAFKELARNFEVSHPGVKVRLNFAGSQQLLQQLVHDAPADVFASADGVQMQAARQAGKVTEARVFARNHLVIVTPAGNPGHLASVADLGRPGMKVILADKKVPAGRYAMEVLAAANVTRPVLANVVSYEDNVRAVLAKVALGEADAGLVYATDVRGAPVSAVTLPAAWNRTAHYPVAVTRHAQEPKLAQEFVGLLLSKAGQQTLVKHGFLPSSR